MSSGSTSDIERLFELSVDLLCIAHTSGYFLRVNPAWTELLGWTAEELCTRPWLDFVHPDDHEVTSSEVGELAEGRSTIRFENRYRTRDGSYRWLAWKCQPDPDTGRLYASARDVTTARQLQRELRERATQLESQHAQLQQRQQESETLSRLIAHHLKQPLSALIGGIETAAEEVRRDDFEVGEHVQQLAWLGDVSHRALETVDGLLLLTELAHESFQPIAIDMGYAFERARERLATRVERRGAVIQAPEQFPKVMGTTSWFVQLWSQLLGGLIDYGDRPRIDVTFAPAGNEMIRFVVSDDGPIQSKTPGEYVFEEFASLDPQRTGSRGLSLAIANRIVSRHGGELQVAQRPPRGLIVQFSLARAP